MSSATGNLLAYLFLVFTRLAGLFTFAPFFGSTSISVRMKAVFAVLLTYLLYPVCLGNAPELPAVMTLGDWFQRELGELGLGMLYGWTIGFVFEAMVLAGQLMSVQFGFSLVNIIDPQTQVETTVLSTFQDLFATLVFLQLGLDRMVLRGLVRSFEILPVGWAHPSLGVAEALLRAATSMWVIGVQLALPVIAATLFVDIALGFLGRATPQFPVLFMGISVKCLLGFAVVMGIAAAWPRVLEHHFQHALAATEALLRLLHP